jgi:hypothetical protein
MEKRKRVYTYVFFFVNNSTEDTAFACKVGKGTGKRAESHKTTFPGYIAGWLPFDCESDLLMLFGVDRPVCIDQNESMEKGSGFDYKGVCGAIGGESKA